MTFSASYYRATLLFYMIAVAAYGAWGALDVIGAPTGSRHGFEVGGSGLAGALVEALYLGLIGAVGFLLAMCLLAALGRSVRRVAYLAAAVLGGLWAVTLPVALDHTMALGGFVRGQVALVLVAMIGSIAVSLALEVLIARRTHPAD
ncbi:MAG: hypothetical protein WD009_03265 [Phycisphaeraceae bacterium]